MHFWPWLRPEPKTLVPQVFTAHGGDRNVGGLVRERYCCPWLRPEPGTLAFQAVTARRRRRVRRPAARTWSGERRDLVRRAHLQELVGRHGFRNRDDVDDSITHFAFCMESARGDDDLVTGCHCLTLARFVVKEGGFTLDDVGMNLLRLPVNLYAR